MLRRGSEANKSIRNEDNELATVSQASLRRAIYSQWCFHAHAVVTSKVLVSLVQMSNLLLSLSRIMSCNAFVQRYVVSSLDGFMAKAVKVNTANNRFSWRNARFSIFQSNCTGIKHTIFWLSELWQVACHTAQNCYFCFSLFFGLTCCTTDEALHLSERRGVNYSSRLRIASTLYRSFRILFSLNIIRAFPHESKELENWTVISTMKICTVSFVTNVYCYFSTELPWLVLITKLLIAISGADLLNRSFLLGCGISKIFQATDTVFSSLHVSSLVAKRNF